MGREYEVIEMKKTVGVEVSWHYENGEIVIDKSDVPFEDAVAHIMLCTPNGFHDSLMEKK